MVLNITCLLYLFLNISKELGVTFLAGLCERRKPLEYSRIFIWFCIEVPFLAICLLSNCQVVRSWGEDWSSPCRMTLGSWTWVLDTWVSDLVENYGSTKHRDIPHTKTKHDPEKMANTEGSYSGSWIQLN